MKKRTMTAEQEQAATVRKEAKRLCAWLKTLSAEEKNAIVERAGAIVTVENRALSPGNTILCYYQREGVTMIGGFRQWLAQGLKKGEKGLSILVPRGKRSATPGGTEGAMVAEDDKVFLVTGTVFDVSQTTAVAHTTGPWKLNGPQIISNGDWKSVVAVLPTKIDPRPTPDAAARTIAERDANARLIASAPELLDAMIRILNCPAMNEDATEVETQEAIKQARAAIRKAAGI
jgi:hypothetical protein